MGASARIAVAVVLLVLVLAACASRSVQERLALDIRRLRQATAGAPGPSWLATLASQRLSDALGTLGAQDLAEPHLVLPVLGLGSGDAVLVVLWVEDRPSVTAIELRGAIGEPENLQVPNEYRIQNAEDSRHSVIFRSVFRWPRAEMPGVLGGPCGVRLISPHGPSPAAALIFHEIEG